LSSLFLILTIRGIFVALFNPTRRRKAYEMTAQQRPLGMVLSWEPGVAGIRSPACSGVCSARAATRQSAGTPENAPGELQHTSYLHGNRPPINTTTVAGPDTSIWPTNHYFLRRLQEKN